MKEPTPSARNVTRRRFLGGMSALGLAAGSTSPASPTGLPPEGKQGIQVQCGAPVPVSEAVFLAIDSVSIPYRRNLYLTMHPVRKHPENPVLRRGKPGEPDEARAQFAGTVLEQDGKFRIWY